MSCCLATAVIVGYHVTGRFQLHLKTFSNWPPCVTSIYSHHKVSKRTLLTIGNFITLVGLFYLINSVKSVVCSLISESSTLNDKCMALTFACQPQKIEQTQSKQDFNFRT